jgi:hypothetical protein
MSKRRRRSVPKTSSKVPPWKGKIHIPSSLQPGRPRSGRPALMQEPKA